MAQQNAVYSFGNNEQGVLILSDGTSYIGNSFGAKKSIAGETVFQTGTKLLNNRNGWLS